jgi:predicted ArsR family transcriptional regulator
MGMRRGYRGLSGRPSQKLLVLRALYRNGGAFSCEVAGMLGLPPASVRSLLPKLRAAGFVAGERCRTPGYRRFGRFVWRLSDEGRRIARGLGLR